MDKSQRFYVYLLSLQTLIAPNLERPTSVHVKVLEHERTLLQVEMGCSESSLIIRSMRQYNREMTIVNLQLYVLKGQFKRSF